MMASSKQGGRSIGTAARPSGESTSRDAVDVNFRRRDQLSSPESILRHTKCGQWRQSLEIYKEMRQSGVKLSTHTFVAALKACSCLKDVESAKQIHGHAVESRCELDVYVGTMLVDVYAKCGRLVDARRLFERMPHRNVVSWTAMIWGYAHMEEGEVALQLFTRMREEGVEPNDRTFVGALKACSNLAEGNDGDVTLVKMQCLEHIRAIHLDIVERKCESNVFVGNILMDAYAKCGSLPDARSVFEKMLHRDVISWNTMIFAYAQTEGGEQALVLFAQMQQEAIMPNGRTFIGALKGCSSLVSKGEGTGCDGICLKKRCLELVKAIHYKVRSSGFETDIYVGNMLLDAYCKCGSLGDARSVFERMPHRNVVSWTAIIMGSAQMDEGESALHLYARMQQEGVVPDARTFVAALKACCSLLILDSNIHHGKTWEIWCLEQVRGIHSDIVKCRAEQELYVGSMLVDAYAKCGSLVDARSVFEKMPHRNVVSWTAMITGYAQMQEGAVALQLYTQMQQEGVVPNERTFIGALKACSSLAGLQRGNGGDGEVQCLEHIQAVHSHIVSSGFESNVFVGTMLLDVYAKCGSLVNAVYIFEKMPHRDVASWNAMIMGYVHMDEGEQGLRLFAQMQQEGVPQDERTFVAALKACGRVAGLEKGKEIHAQILRSGLLTSDTFLASSLIDMYAKCGSMVDAQQMFDALPSRDIVAWSALIAGYACEGDTKLVFHLLKRAREEGIQPDGITFLSILSVCSHGGLVTKGQKYFESMSRDFGINPSIEHYTCLVDLLGRAGQLDEAMAIVKSMPFQPDGPMWEAVLGACQKWCNVELGRHAFERVLKLDHNSAAAYVMMSNIYAAAHLWQEAREIQAFRTQSHAWKKQGQSWWTDMDGVVHAFVVGDREHAKMQYVNAKVEDIVVKLREEECATDECMCQHTPDEEKERFRSPSKQLAIAYASLMRFAAAVKELRNYELQYYDNHTADAHTPKIQLSAHHHLQTRKRKCSCRGYGIKVSLCPVCVRGRVEPNR